MSRYTDEFGPNVQDILCRSSRVISAPIPARVRAELRAAVKAKVLGHLPKDGLKPEIFFHPDHKHGAIERQKVEARYAVECIRSVVAHPLADQHGAFANTPTSEGGVGHGTTSTTDASLKPGMHSNSPPEQVKP